MPSIKLNDQDYQTLHRSLVRSGQKFVDPTFPPNASSINSAAGAASSDVEWRRPSELVSDPHLVVDGIRGSDVMQGERGNAWFVTASAALTTRANLLNCVMPMYSSQEYGPDFHPGIFLFVFSRHGDLYEVVIDDLLPTKKGRLVYAQSCELNEFWSALLEKAYAKLHGDYASLSQGRVVDAVASFVRGIPEHWDMRQMRAEVDVNSAVEQTRLARQFQMYLSRQSLLLFSLQPDNKATRMGDWTKDGLVYGRGYILTELQRVRLTDDKTTVTLLKLQNAWFDLEWSGPWSDNSPEWRSVSLEFRDGINYRAKKDGIFWMSLPDALNQFTDIDICVLTAAGSNSQPWLTHTLRGQWSPELRASSRRAGGGDAPPTAGGSYEYTESYPDNPQYLLTVPGDNPITVSCYLEQGNPATACHTRGQLEIGLDTFSVEFNRKCRLKQPPRESWLHTRVKASRQPSVQLRVTLPPGVYLIVPCTKEPGQEQNYTLRVFSQSDCGIELLPELVPRPSGCCSCCQWKQKAVTRLIVSKITGVGEFLKQTDTMVSVRVDCEASDLQSCQSRYYHVDTLQKDSYNLDFKVLLYRHQTVDPIDIEVFCQSAHSFTKQFIGAAAILDKDCAVETNKDAMLQRNGKEISVKIFCAVQSSNDLDYF